ncbi:hypothetical protein ACNOYE_37245 [Nannocystaceae bacterium ST9]
MRSILPITLICLSTTIAACSDDTTSTDEVGDTSSSTDATDSGSTDATESGSTDATDSSSTDTDSSESSSADTTETTETTDETTETTGGGMCNADDVVDLDITLGLVGSQALPNSCNDHTFTGTLEGGGNGNWNLDACPCGANCLIPDPYTLSIITPSLDTLPNVPSCPKIEMRRNADCEVVSIVISDLAQNEAPVWIGSREDIDPGSVPELDASAELFGVCECPDCDPPTLYDMRFDWEAESIVVSEGSTGVVADWDATVISSHHYEVGDVDWFAWVMKR